MVARPRNISVTETSRPILPRHAKLRFDDTRQRWVILVPERVLAPDEIAVEVLQLCDGTRRVDDVVDLLAAKYVADRAAISADVIAMLQNLADKGFLVEAREAERMSPTFTDAAPLPYDSADGLSILESAEVRRGDLRHSPRRAGRTDASLLAAMPVLLQPGRTGARRQRTDHGRMEKGADRAR